MIIRILSLPVGLAMLGFGISQRNTLEARQVGFSLFFGPAFILYGIGGHKLLNKFGLTNLARGSSNIEKPNGPESESDDMKT